jgi:hypothetical protein
MCRTLLASAALLGMACGPVLAQNTTSSTMSPPAPNAGVGTPEPTNSLPAGAGTATRMAPGNNVGTTGGGGGRPAPMRAMPTTEPMSTAPADTGMTGMRPMRGQMHHGRMAHGHGTAGEAGATEPTTSPGREYRGGAGSPMSTRTSNSTAANTRSEIAPRLPDPAAGANTPQSYLAAAQRALNSGRTGAAQEALERAETRLLSRSTEQSMAGSPDASPMVQQIGEARRALAARDTAAAKSAISAAMSSGG